MRYFVIACKAKQSDIYKKVALFRLFVLRNDRRQVFLAVLNYFIFQQIFFHNFKNYFMAFGIRMQAVFK